MGATYLGQAQSAEQQAGRMAGAAGGMIAGLPQMLNSTGTTTTTVTQPSGAGGGGFSSPGIPTGQPVQEWT